RLGRARQHDMGEDDEIGPDLAHQPGYDDAVQHPIGVIRDEYDWARLRHSGQRVRVIADVELERTHRGPEETLAGAGKALVLHIHALELGLARRFLDQPDQPPLDRRIARGSVAEEIFVHWRPMFAAGPHT